MLFAADRRVKKRFVSHPLPSATGIADFYASLRGRGNSFVFVIFAPNHLSSSSVIEIQRSCLRSDTSARKNPRERKKKNIRKDRKEEEESSVESLWTNKSSSRGVQSRTNERPNRVCKVDIGSRIKHRWQTVPLMRRILEPDRTLLRPFPSNFWIRALNIYRPSYSQIHPPRRSLSLSLSISISVPSRIKESTDATSTILHLNKTKQFPGLCSRLKPI